MVINFIQIRWHEIVLYVSFWAFQKKLNGLIKYALYVSFHAQNNLSYMKKCFILWKS